MMLALRRSHILAYSILIVIIIIICVAFLSILTGSASHTAFIVEESRVSEQESVKLFFLSFFGALILSIMAFLGWLFFRHQQQEQTTGAPVLLSDGSNASVSVFSPEERFVQTSVQFCAR